MIVPLNFYPPLPRRRCRGACASQSAAALSATLDWAKLAKLLPAADRAPFAIAAGDAHLDAIGLVKFLLGSNEVDHESLLQSAFASSSSSAPSSAFSAPSAPSWSSSLSSSAPFSNAVYAPTAAVGDVSASNKAATAAATPKERALREKLQQAEVTLLKQRAQVCNHAGSIICILALSHFMFTLFYMAISCPLVAATTHGLATLICSSCSLTSIFAGHLHKLSR